ncbi:MAG TPA: patatin-like phospholipase family protein [Caulobacteraceae bacterium]|nr:patatin-like phospholipase family protein [Caulobacteraceae bacterium]
MTRSLTEARRRVTQPPTCGFGSVALLLQGGGALGAYQGGVYEGLVEHGVEPNWIAGISIGAINSAIIAGNPLKERVGKLRAFWEAVSGEARGAGAFWSGTFAGQDAHRASNEIAAGEALVSGVPGFFAPRIPPAPLQPKNTLAATSWYETKDLRPTLEHLVDFDRINSRDVRLSVGAVNVRTGNFAYFDNHRCPIHVEHVMASAALPPGFPAIEIDGEFYWDGGLVTNNPLSWVLAERTGRDTLIFQVDLWSSRGPMPGDLAQVAVRMKEIQFSSRTRAVTDGFRRAQELRASFHEFLSQLPVELAAMPRAKALAEALDPAVYNIVEIIYRSQAYEGQSKDYAFSRQTMEDHWRAGYRDANRTLSHPEVFERPATPSAVKVFDYLDPP